jgi:hypothetical protein
MGRNARLKKQRRIQRNQEAWDQFLKPGYLTEIRQMILASGATADSCICATKVLCQIGESLGLRVKPLVVEAYVYNAAFVMHFANYGFDVDEKVMAEIAERGGRYVAVGCRQDPDRVPEEGKWLGHLVAVVFPPRDVQARPHVVDISMDQAHRPEKGLLLQEAITFPIPSKRFLTGNEDAIGLTDVGGVKMCIAYKAYPGVTDYEVSPDWQRDYEAKAHDSVPLDGLPQETPDV